MKSVKQYKKEIELLTEKQSNRQTTDDLVKIKSGVRSKYDYCYIQFWDNKIEDSICDIELNKKESEILRRFLYNLKKRNLNT